VGFVPSGKPLLTIRGPEDLDELDRQIIALVRDNPDISSREIAEYVKSTHVTVAARRKRLSKTPWGDFARQELERMAPGCLEAIADGLKHCHARERADLAIRTLKGLGILTDTRKLEIDYNDPDAVRGLLNQIPDKVLDEIANDDDASTGG
jgi:hypothetical protein